MKIIYDSLWQRIVYCFDIMELGISCLFTCTVALGFCFSDDRWEYIFK